MTLWKFHIIHPDPAHLPVASYLSHTPASWHPKINLKQTELLKTHQNYNSQVTVVHTFNLRTQVAKAGGSPQLWGSARSTEWVQGSQN